MGFATYFFEAGTLAFVSLFSSPRSELALPLGSQHQPFPCDVSPGVAAYWLTCSSAATSLLALPSGGLGTRVLLDFTSMAWGCSEGEELAQLPVSLQSPGTEGTCWLTAPAFHQFEAAGLHGRAVLAGSCRGTSLCQSFHAGCQDNLKLGVHLTARGHVWNWHKAALVFPSLWR